MSDKETSRQKVERIALSIGQHAFVLVAIFSLFGIAIGLYSWVALLFQEVFLLEVSAIYFLSFFVSVFIVTRLEKRLRQLRPKREGYSLSFRSNLKQFGIYFLTIEVVIVGLSAMEGYFGLFPETVSVSLGLEILKTVIQANGFLIGLSGVVFAQMFWAINHQQNTVQVNILQNPKYDESENDIRIHYVNALDKKRRDMTIMMSVVIGLFMLSIALSLSGMARTELYETELIPTYPNIRNPLFFTILGISFFVVSIATSKMSLEEDVKKFKKKSVHLAKRE